MSELCKVTRLVLQQQNCGRTTLQRTERRVFRMVGAVVVALMGFLFLEEMIYLGGLVSAVQRLPEDR